MGLLDSTTHREYYQGNDFGDYQFTSLENIINQFQIVYVGEDKLISKVKRVDVAFHAMRALQELSFDTFKSVKSHQIDLPPTLVMPLPHDYVSYTKLSWVDPSGIKYPLYQTNDTNNPFQIRQEENGSYAFDPLNTLLGVLENSDFSEPLTPAWKTTSIEALNSNITGGVDIVDEVLKSSFHTASNGGGTNNAKVHTVYQAIDVSDINSLDISASGVADTIIMSAPSTGTYAGVTNTTPNRGVLRFGLSSRIPDASMLDNRNNAVYNASTPSGNLETTLFDLLTNSGNESYIEWQGPTTVGSTSSDEEILDINVSDYNVVYAVIVSFINSEVPAGASKTRNTGQEAFKANSIDNVVVTNANVSNSLLVKKGNERNSSTWNNYKSITPSENNNDDYEDDTYWPMASNRYGLDPQRAQINGSFYIDQRLGRIHFSSNVSGKPVILDYISDSLGTDAEMQVHKFAEEAMYKYIIYAILSTRANINENIVRRYKKERFAAIRTAKLRLSSIKLEEITQILRGKSKQIKH
tara:strand:- start:10744 stop:12318 length:1575 start_codon:yes stop_codon:yes gene_type:complete